jgi:light-harvesting protein B-800-850 alpha chain
MNNAKMWLVVPPAVGVPVFLGAVAIGSFAVHVAVLGKTNWYSDYLVGQLGETMEQEASALMLEGSDAKNASFAVQNPDGTQQVLVILPDGTTTTAILKMPEVVKTGMASAPLTIEQ